MVEMLIPGLSPPAALALDPETTHQPCPHQCSCLVHLWLQVVIEVELVLIGAPPPTHTHTYTHLNSHQLKSPWNSEVSQWRKQPPSYFSSWQEVHAIEGFVFSSLLTMLEQQ